jgi:hypothetical protein
MMVLCKCSVCLSFLWLFHIWNTKCAAPWSVGAVMYCSILMFLKVFHISKNRSVMRILLEASKIAPDLFVIKLTTCKGFSCLVTVL